MIYWGCGWHRAFALMGLRSWGKIDNKQKTQTMEEVREAMEKNPSRPVLRSKGLWGGAALTVTFELKPQKVEQQGWGDSSETGACQAVGSMNSGALQQRDGGFSVHRLLKWRGSWWEGTTIKDKESWWSRRVSTRMCPRALSQVHGPVIKCYSFYDTSCCFSQALPSGGSMVHPGRNNGHGIRATLQTLHRLSPQSPHKRQAFCLDFNLEFSSTPRGIAFILCPWWPPGWSPIKGCTFWGKLEHHR